MHRQKGITLSGFLLWAIVICFALLLGFKIGPPYLEYMTIKRQLQAIGKDDAIQGGKRSEVELAFTKRSMIEDMKSVKPADLIITKEGDGVIISAEYTNCVHVVANLRACMDFAPSSRIK
jgi:hypothetical protein